VVRGLADGGSGGMTHRRRSGTGWGRERKADGFSFKRQKGGEGGAGGLQGGGPEMELKGREKVQGSGNGETKPGSKMKDTDEGRAFGIVFKTRIVFCEIVPGRGGGMRR